MCWKIDNIMNYKIWSHREIEKLKELYPNTTNEIISKILKRGIFSVSSKANFLDLHKSSQFKSKLLGERNKKMGRDLTPTFLMDIASKYKTRSEFQLKDGSAYQTARRSGLLDEFCQHMSVVAFSAPQLILRELMDGLLKSKSVYNNRKIIPPYEIDIYYPEFNLAVEYNGRGWHRSNERDLIKQNLLTKKNIPVLYFDENTRKYEKDIKNQIVQHLEKINFICNKKLLASDVFSYPINNVYLRIYNKTDLLNIAKQYTSFRRFRELEKSVYCKLLKMDLMDEATNHMKDRVRRHTLQGVKGVVGKYSSLSDLIKNDFGTYLYSRRNKLSYLVCHLTSKRNSLISSQ